MVFPQKQDPRDKWEDEEPMAMATLEKARSELKTDPSRNPCSAAACL
jgi:hypothetical protein